MSNILSAECSQPPYNHTLMDGVCRYDCDKLKTCIITRFYCYIYLFKFNIHRNGFCPGHFFL